MSRWTCIGVPYWLGAPEQASAVRAIEASGIAAELDAPWIEVEPDFTRFDDPVAAVGRALAEVVGGCAPSVPLVFAADCVAALGAVHGLERLAPAVLWLDAHGDFNTPATSPSGFLGGMPLAALVGRGNERLVATLGLRPVAETDVILAGARNLDPAEARALAESRVLCLQRIEDLADRALPAKPLYLHVDTDVVQPEEMPAQNYPAAGGTSLASAAGVLRSIAGEADIAGALFSLWNESRPGAERARASTLRLVRALAAGGAVSGTRRQVRRIAAAPNT